MARRRLLIWRLRAAMGGRESAFASVNHPVQFAVVTLRWLDPFRVTAHRPFDGQPRRAAGPTISACAR
jgi:hypothetical protein